MVLRKKEQKARHEMGGKTDKIPGIFIIAQNCLKNLFRRVTQTNLNIFFLILAANDEVQEWEVKLEESRLNFNKISDVIKAEIDFFERYRVKDFKSSILRYMEDLMECQIQLAQTWETFLPEVKNTLY